MIYSRVVLLLASSCALILADTSSVKDQQQDEQIKSLSMTVEELTSAVKKMEARPTLTPTQKLSDGYCKQEGELTVSVWDDMAGHHVGFVFKGSTHCGSCIFTGRCIAGIL